MSHLPFTLLAYFLNSVAVTVDKFLLTRHIQNPLVYIFYISSVSLLALSLLPFTRIPTLSVFILASTSTVLWTTGLYYLYKALQTGHVSRVVPVIGSLIPLMLLGEAVLSLTITQNQIWAVLILVLGLVFLTLPDWKGNITRKEIVLVILSSLFFAISYVVLRRAYLQENFLTVLVYSRFILIPLALIILVVPVLRKIVLTNYGVKVNILSKTGLLFLIGQVSGGIQELLLTFSVSLASPALVNSLQGTQYAFIFLFSLILSKKFPEVFKENFSKAVVLSKVAGIIFLGLGLYIVAFSDTIKKEEKSYFFGVTFSPRYAQSLGLDPKAVYSGILDEIGVKRLRLPLYWDEIEKNKDEPDQNYMRYYLDEAQKRGIEVILVLGYKQPRWPECFTPSWAEKLSDQEFESAILNLVSKEVEAYKDYSQVKYWQVENEPTLKHFGQNCKSLGKDFLKKEVERVKSLDERPIIITGSGELDTWVVPVSLSDVFGTTLYRKVYNDIFGFTTYPLPPSFYNIKSKIIKKFFAPGNQKTIIIELQTEPWSPKNNLSQQHIEEQIKVFSLKDFKENLDFAKKTGFDDIYLWGGEWWYFMKEKGYPEYWEYAKSLF